MVDQIYDVIVIGVGSMGASTCYYVAKQNAKVLGIDRLIVPHDEGSHTGQSRIIRKAYFEHPNYVPILEHAYQNWADIEEEFDQKLFYKTGLYYAGQKEGALISGLMKSAEKYNIDITHLSSSEAKSKYPQLQIPDSFSQIIEPNSGFVLPEKTIINFKKHAILQGAVIKENEEVISWNLEHDLVVVHTNKATYKAAKLVITAGAGTEKLYHSSQTTLKVTRQSLFWISMKDPKRFTYPQFPCWNIVDPEIEGLFYGFPIVEEAQRGGFTGFKIAHHVEQEVVNPDDFTKSIPKGEEEIIIHILNKYFPNAFQSVKATATCLYSNSVDHDFIIDHLPNTNQKVTIACGFSGHGFKFVPAIGDILADLALHGSSPLPIGFLGLR